MKTICLRLITLVLLAAGLNFVADAGIKIEQGKVFLVGRCSFTDQCPKTTPDAPFASMLVGIAQAEFVADPNGSAAFSVKKIITVRPDSAGFFMVKNVPAGFTYIFLGVQLDAAKPLQVKSLTVVNAFEKQGSILDLGHHQINLPSESADSIELKLVRDCSVEQYMQHFIGKDNVSRFVHHVCNRAGYWGKGNALTSIDASRLQLFGLSKAAWQKVLLNS